MAVGLTWAANGFELIVDEVAVFRCYDSRAAAQGEPYRTLHSAFRIPAVADGASGRESIEMRVPCGFN